MKKKKINNKGFTLVELLAVIAILVTIVMIAIPSITASLERSKEKTNNNKKELLISAAEVYVSMNRNAIYSNYSAGSSCDIELDKLGVSDKELADADGITFKGCIRFKRKNSTETLDTYSYVYSCDTGSLCN